MAFPGISVDGAKPFFNALCDAKVVDDCSFSFYLSQKPNEDGSTLVLGGVDPKYADGDFKYYDLVSETYWPVKMPYLTIKGKKYTTVQGIVDTGTSVLVVD